MSQAHAHGHAHAQDRGIGIGIGIGCNVLATLPGVDWSTASTAAR
ncbi:hypothetical protein [Streptomyces sp. NPDC047525]